MNRWEFLHNWYMPFAWITLAALISVPVAVYFQLGMELHAGSELGLPYGDQWVVRDDFLASIVVYAMNLGALIWLFNGDGTTRWAAFWASLIGLSRLIMPIALASMADVQLGVNRHFIDWETMRIVVWSLDAQMFALGLMVWFVFGRFAGEHNTGVRNAMGYAEA